MSSSQTTFINGAPLASICVLCYNNARYLPAMLDSALAQTHPNVETVGVDDGPPTTATNSLYGSNTLSRSLRSGFESAKLSRISVEMLARNSHA